MESVGLGKKYRQNNDYRNTTMTQRAPPLVPSSIKSNMLQNQKSQSDNEEALLGFYHLNILAYSKDRPF